MAFSFPLTQLSDYLWEIPQSFRPDMRVPARLYSSQKLLDDIKSDKSIDQLVNTATLPGIEKYALAMPDMHQGYGFPIGGVVATNPDKDGIISPGGVGYDINCGVRLLASQLSYDGVKPRLNQIVNQIHHNIPSGVGIGGDIKIDRQRLDRILNRGVKQLAKDGYALKDDLNYIESNGCLPNADADAVSHRAKSRGLTQIGTLGSGNHFLEIQRVDKMYESSLAETFGLFLDQIVVMVHSGSRGLGHQTATDYMKLMHPKLKQWGIELPDRQLVCAPFESQEGQDYFAAMNAAANFAFANRQAITWRLRKIWSDIFGANNHTLKLIYDVSHNMAKLEEDLLVHRKGAIRAFPAGHHDIPKAYRKVGHPVLIPGSMGTASYVLVGQPAALEQTFGTVCHGAGRRLSRTQAKQTIQGSQLKSQLEDQSIVIGSDSMRGLAEEAPDAYKDIHEIIRVISQSGLAKPVAQLKPVGVVKGN